MQKINIVIPTKNNHYAIYLGENILKNIPLLIDLDQYSTVFIFTDSNVARLYLSLVRKIFSNKKNIYHYSFAAGEKNKNINTVLKTINYLSKLNLDRKALFVNLGGGATSDMGGFISSIFKRGIDFINIPTTLEAMVDASVGGKVGINIKQLKNYIGLFNHPLAVFIDINFLTTVPQKILLSGYAEVIKHGLIADQKYFSYLTKIKPEKNNNTQLLKIISQSIKIKSQIIADDERETKGIRKILNFGHTIGHALESLSLRTKNPLYHGEAVAIGMVAESRLAQEIGWLDKKDVKLIEKTITKYNLPTRVNLAEMTVDKVRRYLLKDKKNHSRQILWVLLKKIGQAKFDVVVPKNLVDKVIYSIL